ncbi:MAG: SMP-30/gluconolactonase/LRE family protein [Leptolyngbyaceae cyanobacterium MO_188.B28]|nr:SMP-30/gluconolactonase/LRE family protein [Leptolyngbyaceae cyanobacterium MO_188.B28]
MKRGWLLKLLSLTGLGLPSLGLGFVLWPSPIDPVPFTPSPALPETGVLAPNDALRDPDRTQKIGPDQLNYPEDIAFDAQGRMYVGNRDRPNAVIGSGDVNARIDRVTFTPDGGYQIEEFVNLPGGGPLDLRFDQAGDLLVSSWGQGLIAVSPAGQVRPIVPEGEMIEGRPYGYSDGIAIATDGKIYHTQGTDDSYTQQPPVISFIANTGPGRLIVTDPDTGNSQVLIDDLSFGNGVVLAPDESYVLVADQLRYRILRYWLKGEKAGEQDIWIDSLPGMPHNLYRDQKNRIWVALNRPRVGLGDQIRASRFLAQQVAKVPFLVTGQDVENAVLDESTRGAGSVLAMDFDANILLSLQNPPISMNTLSAAVLHQEYVYIGTIGGGPVLRYRLDKLD